MRRLAGVPSSWEGEEGGECERAAWVDDILVVFVRFLIVVIPLSIRCGDEESRPRWTQLLAGPCSELHRPSDLPELDPVTSQHSGDSLNNARLLSHQQLSHHTTHPTPRPLLLTPQPTQPQPLATAPSPMAPSTSSTAAKRIAREIKQLEDKDALPQGCK